MGTVIKAENLGKSYLIGHQRESYYALRDVLVNKARQAVINTKKFFSGGQLVDGNEIEEFWALKDVSFEVQQGDRLGIIGRNGAGKSTLLKVLSRITEPTTGRLSMKGRVASLLEVGTGFHPELTGRENIFLNGAILGMSRAEVRKKFDEIVDFSGVEKFLDTPVKRYSSGMYVRLAFAVAAHMEPEILIVDEVLAVGDAEFQKKCLGKMEDVSKTEGRTVLFVSHNMGAIQSLCTNAILLNNGKIEISGFTNEIVQFYFNSGIKKDGRPSISKYRNYKTNESPIVIEDIFIKDSKDEIPTFPMNHIPTIVVTVRAKRKIENANITILFYNSEGLKSELAFSWDDNFYLNIEEGLHEIEFTQSKMTLSPGIYTVGVGINQSCYTTAWDDITYYPLFKIENQNNVKQWDFRPWAVHHSWMNKWESIKISANN